MLSFATDSHFGLTQHTVQCSFCNEWNATLHLKLRISNETFYNILSVKCPKLSGICFASTLGISFCGTTDVTNGVLWDW